MFGHLLNRLHAPRSSRVAFGSSRRHLAWTGLAVLAALLLFVGLDTNDRERVAAPLDQLGAEGSALRWLERAEAIAELVLDSNGRDQSPARVATCSR